MSPICRGWKRARESDMVEGSGAEEEDAMECSGGGVEEVDTGEV